MKEFAILPWEHLGASFDPNCHARTRLEIGGRKRSFQLKMRDGIIYFKQSNSGSDLNPANVYAITKIFSSSLAQNPKELVETWKSEMEVENYGVSLQTRYKWLEIPGETNFCAIYRADGTCWVKEFFDPTWKEFLSSSPSAVDFWQRGGCYVELGEGFFRDKEADFLQRVVDPAHLESISTGWTHGTGQEFIDLVRAAFQLFASPFPQDLSNKLTCYCKSHSPFQQGYINSELFQAGYRFPRFDKVFDYLIDHYVFISLQWRKVTDHPELQAQFRSEFWHRGIDRWGENWRGNWVPNGISVELAIPPVSAPSHHEKLESALLLRNWLKDKMPAEQIEALFQSINLR